MVGSPDRRAAVPRLRTLLRDLRAEVDAPAGIGASAGAAEVKSPTGLHGDRVDVTIVKQPGLHVALASDERLLGSDRTTAQVSLPVCLGSNRRTTASRGSATTDGPDTTLIAALRRAHRMLAHDSRGPVLEAAPASIYDRKILRLALLAPDIQRDIFAGRQPRGFNLEAFVQGDAPLAWAEQRRAFGWR